MRQQRKKYATEFEHSESENNQPKKKIFSLKTIEAQKQQNWHKFKSFLEKCLIIVGALIIICMGHIYGAIAIILMSTMIYNNVISEKRKEDQSKLASLQWIDWYAYLRDDWIHFHIGWFYSNHFLFEERNIQTDVEEDRLDSDRTDICILFPLLCVPINTLCASIIGITIGYTPLNRNLPSKTIEGYIGGLVLTCIFAFFRELSFAIFEGIQCEIPDLYIKKNMEINFLTEYVGYFKIYASPAQIHSIFLSIFASLLSPFAQFCIIGLKKAFRIQVNEQLDETGSLEEAVNDIFRVQGVLAVNVFIYITQMVFRSAVTLEKVVQYIDQLNNEDKIKLMEIINLSIHNQSTLGV
ncbi:phosphatidate cytidylyltransferase [Stylonychia lemnae]|uniref:phosphatidate cytidylyltransferase n=1 Tax=Stylonychia lemnae TaxID=5949 RepID=A0A078AA54_STYLE|nr:phosphatidate cytidylyltransferase [Stylonychia lemnae]|eukprot:CDW79160.1 phosphatidate cytidylyltransferase [Stylonychia lemnae]